MNIKKYFGLLAGVATLGLLVQSCAVDEPFGQDGEGELRMKLVINSDLKRSETDPADLGANCVVYISGSKGLLYKYKGIENVPESLNLKNGHYVAEAWTGDSVSASFDKKFFRGYQPFDINSAIENVVLKCRIANVVVSINNNSVNSDLMKDWKVNVAHSKGNLDFTAENMDYAKGYFMMPQADKDLTVTVTGTNMLGESFTKTQIIANVERAHEYVLNFAYNPEVTDPTDGGAFLTITVDDTEVEVNDEVTLLGRPSVTGVDWDATHQLVGNAGKFKDTYIKVNCFGGVSHLYMTSDDYAALNLPSNDIDLPLATPEVKQAINDAGFIWEYTYNADKNLVTGYITLSAKFLNKIPERDTEYVLNLKVEDKYGKYTELPLRLAVGEGAIVIDDPVVANDIDQSDLMAVLSTRATLTGSIVNAEAVNPGIRYREAGTSDWTFVAASGAALNKARRSHMSKMQAVRSGGTPFTVTLTGLKPGTRYEYQAAADGFEASESLYFTTEGTFTIPNADMETWGSYSAKTMLGTKTVVFPGTSRDNYFWDSGNEGAATANKTVLNKSGDMHTSGSYSARLASDAAMGIIAAGNMFAGRYVKTDGTDGVLSLGREFDGSHPAKLRVNANYRPGGSVKIKDGNAKYVDITSGGSDHGQIYIALTTAPIEIRTKAANRKLFPATATNEDGNPSEDFDKVVAYGQITWDKAFGPDGQLQTLDIPFVYNDRAKTQKPLYLVIVASASKFGDFYCGSSSSVMYLDDFQLIYE